MYQGSRKRTAGRAPLSIHPTAVVSDRARISPEATIGPFCVIRGSVTIGAGTVLDSHVRIGSELGEVVIGKHNLVQSGAALGGPPQDWSYNDGVTRLEIGDHNRIGENATVSLGSVKSRGVTRIGNHAMLMAYSHVGHDCVVCDHVVLTNLAQIAGHVLVEERAVIGGICGVSQFVRIGALSFVAVGAMVNKDILPYTIAEGHWAVPKVTNRVGLRRAGHGAAEIRAIDRAVRLLLDRSLKVDDALERIRGLGEPSPPIAHLIEFATASGRGLARP